MQHVLASCGETRHSGTKEQENSYCSERCHVKLDCAIDAGAIVVHYSSNISQHGTE